MMPASGSITPASSFRSVGLSSAVDPDQGDLIFPGQGQVDAGVYLHGAVSLVDSFQFRHDSSAADGLGKEKRMVFWDSRGSSISSIFSRVLIRL